MIQTKVYMTVLEVVSNEGQVMLSDFFMQNLRLNAIAYIKLLYTVVKLWIERVIIHVPSVLCTLPHNPRDPCDPRVAGQEFSQLYHLMISRLLVLI